MTSGMPPSSHSHSSISQQSCWSLQNVVSYIWTFFSPHFHCHNSNHGLCYLSLNCFNRLLTNLPAVFLSSFQFILGIVNQSFIQSVIRHLINTLCPKMQCSSQWQRADHLESFYVGSNPSSVALSNYLTTSHFNLLFCETGVIVAFT